MRDLVPLESCRNKTCWVCLTKTRFKKNLINKESGTDLVRTQIQLLDHLIRKVVRYLDIHSGLAWVDDYLPLEHCRTLVN